MKHARLKRALRQNASDAPTWIQLATALLKSGALDEARTAAEAAVECAQNGAQIVAASALLHRVGRPDLALVGYQRATRLEPESVDAWGALGRFALRFNRPAIACAALKQACALAPTDATLRVSLARALFAHQEPVRAARVFEALWIEAPDDVGLAFELAEAASAAGEGDLAIRAIRMAALAAPERLDIRLRLTACVARHGTVEAALALLEGLRTDWPRSPEVLLNMASAQAALGQTDTALSLIEDARQLRPHQPIIDRNRGAILFGAARYTEAAESFQALTRRMPENAEAHLRLAIVMHRLHRVEAARMSAERAIALAGESPVGTQARRLRDALVTPPTVEAAEPAESTGPVEDAAVILSGMLERVPVTQVLEFARTNGTTGRLLLSGRDGVADIRVNAGHLVAARCSNSPNLIDRLVSHGWLARATVTAWIERRRLSRQRSDDARPVEAALVEVEMITQAQLDQVVEEQIISVVTAVVHWGMGTFKLVDAGAEEVAGAVSLRIDGVLLDVLRRLDEARAAG